MKEQQKSQHILLFYLTVSQHFVRGTAYGTGMELLTSKGQRSAEFQVSHHLPVH